jgi:hypothetical protein
MAVLNDCKRCDGVAKKVDKVRLLHESAKLSLCGRRGDLLSMGNDGSAFLSGKSKSLEPLVSSELVKDGVRGKCGRGSSAVTGRIATAIGYLLVDPCSGVAKQDNFNERGRGS